MTTNRTHRSTVQRARPLAALAAAALLAWPAAAAAQQPQQITLDEAVRIALRQNSALRLARNATELQDVAVRQQRMALFPDLQLSTRSSQSFGRNFLESEGRIVNTSTQSVNAGISSSVVLFDGFGNTASLREARLARAASERSEQRTRQTVVFDVLSDYLTLIAQQEQLVVRRQALETQEAEERRIQAFVDAGARTIADLYQQQAQVASARLALVEAERALELARVDVMQTLQLDPMGEYAFVAPPVDAAAPAARSYTLPQLLQEAFAQRADLQAQQTEVAAAEQGIRAAKASYWPTVSLTAGYNTAFNSASEFSFLDQFDQRRGGSVGIGISVPLWDRSSASLATERAQIQAENARIGLQDLRQEVGLQVRRAYLDYQAAQQQLRAAEAQLRAADLALEVSRERYEVGASTLFELTQARSAQIQAASALVSARYNLLFQDKLIAYYTGELDPEQVSLD